MANNAATNGRQRRVNLIAQSPAAAELYAERRIGKVPVLSADEAELIGTKLIPADELPSLLVDETYQRAEVTAEVNELSHVLRSGGIIPDAVSLAVRADGRMAVVDGQQRYWAHLDCGIAMRADLWRVRDQMAERKLFEVLNNRTLLTTATRIAAWTGPITQVLHRLDEHPDSPFRGLVAWKGKVRSTFPVSILMRGLLALVSGGPGRGGVRTLLTGFDHHYEHDRKWSDAAIQRYATILTSVFYGARAGDIRGPIAVAFGRTCHLRWDGLYYGNPQLWDMPSDKQIRQLQQVDWTMPQLTYGTRAVAVGEAEIEKVWPMPLQAKRKLETVR